jgi:hypothetical protein
MKYKQKNTLNKQLCCVFGIIFVGISIYYLINDNSLYCTNKSINEGFFGRFSKKARMKKHKDLLLKQLKMKNAVNKSLVSKLDMSDTHIKKIVYKIRGWFLNKKIDTNTAKILSAYNHKYTNANEQKNALLSRINSILKNSRNDSIKQKIENIHLKITNILQHFPQFSSIKTTYVESIKEIENKQRILDKISISLLKYKPSIESLYNRNMFNPNQYNFNNKKCKPNDLLCITKQERENINNEYELKKETYETSIDKTMKFNQQLYYDNKRKKKFIQQKEHDILDQEKKNRKYIAQIRETNIINDAYDDYIQYFK